MTNYYRLSYDRNGNFFSDNPSLFEEMDIVIIDWEKEECDRYGGIVIFDSFIIISDAPDIYGLKVNAKWKGYKRAYDFVMKRKKPAWLAGFSIL